MKVALCIPVHSRPETRFVDCLLKLIYHSIEAVPGIALNHSIVSSSDIRIGRSRLVAEAIAMQATHLLWMDVDHVFPADALARLLAHNVEVVGCNYRQRHAPFAPVAMRDGVHVATNRDSPALEQVDALGFGLCLVRRSVLGRLAQPLFAGQDKGEDYIFFERVRQAGIAVHADHALSLEVGHISETTVWNC